MIELNSQLASPTIASIVEDIRPVPPRWEASKRVVDITLALTGLIVTLPFLLAAIIAVLISSPGNPFFIQQRVGRFGKPFHMLKLRTMTPDADQHEQPILKKLRRDDRVFPIGHLLRKTSLDEIPNLVNVLKGEMSIVGPRPMLPKEHLHCTERHGHNAVSQRLSTRPGVTGLWQVSGRAELHFDERVELDIKYAMTWTPMDDIRIIAKTIPVLFLGRGAF